MSPRADQFLQSELKMKHTTTLALLGVGGYGWVYTQPLLDPELCRRHNVKLIAGVDPNPSCARHLNELTAAGVPIYATTAELYANQRPDVVILASPIHFHCEQVIEALDHGCHVLCEKPLCVTIDQARQMQLAADRSACQVAIGYQWSFSAAITKLKADILAGDFGAARRARSLTLWPRDEGYYTRNGWAGRRTAAGGRPVMDSPINNACAHFLHNLLYLLGPRPRRSALPIEVTAELYRANAIETFDTAALRARVWGDVDLLMIASHATAETREPVFEIEFDRATVTYSAAGGDGQSDDRLLATLADGTVRDYGRPSGATDATKLWSSVAAFRSGTPVSCGIDAATPQTMVVSAADASCPEPMPFPAGLVHVSGEVGRRKTSVAGLADVLTRAYAEWALPSEMNVDWAVAGVPVRVSDLHPDVRPAMPTAADATHIPAATL